MDDLKNSRIYSKIIERISKSTYYIIPLGRRRRKKTWQKSIDRAIFILAVMLSHECGWENINELAFFFGLDDEKENVKKNVKIVQIEAVDHEDDVKSLVFVVVLSGASAGSNSPPSSDTCCGACDSEEKKDP